MSSYDNDLQSSQNQNSKIVTMLPKFMSTIPSNPFSSNPFSANSNPFSGSNLMNESQPARVPSESFGNAFNRIEGSNPGMQSFTNYSINPNAHRRFSLNPLPSIPQNIDQLDKRFGLAELNSRKF